MKTFNIIFLDSHKYPEIKPFPNYCQLDCKPNIGEVIEIGKHHFKVVKILHRPSVQNIHYNQPLKDTIVFVEYD